MNEPGGPVCWMVLAPFPAAELARFAAEEWARRFPYAVDPPPWDAVAGSGEYAALVSRQPGAEGKDRPFAVRASRRAGDRAVYSLWLDAERAEIFEWRGGGETRTLPGDPSDFAERLGVPVEREAPARQYRLAVVEGASAGEVRAALGEAAGEAWLRVDPGPAGVLVTSTDGAIGTQAWDVAEALPRATVYLVQRWPDRDAFEVRILRGTEEVGVFALRGDAGDAEPSVDEVRGARTPAAIAAALGIPPARLGLDRLPDP